MHIDRRGTPRSAPARKRAGDPGCATRPASRSSELGTPGAPAPTVPRATFRSDSAHIANGAAPALGWEGGKGRPFGCQIHVRHAPAIACVGSLLLAGFWGGCRVMPAGPSAPVSASPGATSPAATSQAATGHSATGAGATPLEIATEYDLVYAITHARINPSPSPFLVATVTAAGKPPAGATALDIGSGAGRNALYLARQGYQVTGVDLSRIGLDLTQQAAAQDHLPVTTVAEDINKFPIGEKRWDLITLIDFPFAYRALLPRIAAGLKPGGLLVLQDVSSKQSGLESPDHALTYTFMDHQDLAGPFAGFTVLHDTEDEQPTTWGVKAIMIRFAGRKPQGGLSTAGGLH